MMHDGAAGRRARLPVRNPTSGGNKTLRRHGSIGLMAMLVSLIAAVSEAQPAHVKLRLEAPASATTGSKLTLVATLQIAPGFHIQSNKPAPNYIATTVSVTAPAGFVVGSPAFPPASLEQAAGETIPVFSGDVRVTVPVTVERPSAGAHTLKVVAGYQACDEGSCYPPSEVAGEVTIRVENKKGEPPITATRPSTIGTEATPSDPGEAANKAGQNGAVVSPEPRDAVSAEPPPPVTPKPDAPAAASFAGYRTSRVTEFVGPEQFVRFLEEGDVRKGDAGGVSGLLQSGNLLVALPLIFLLGLALNLTPCVYPIIPITISYFGTQAGRDGKPPFVLAVVYVLGMALMYSALGVAAGLTGSLFGSQLQNPWVLTAFAVVMFGLALSQFDRPDGRPIWEFQLPGFLRNRAQSRSGILGALIMGLMVGVVAAPCIGPAVIALLQWVGTQRDPVLGFGVFFTLALGLGLPYLALATVSGSVKAMPRAGEWMVGVKHVFGAVLVWMGVYYLQTPLALLHPEAGRAALVAISGLIALYLLFFERSGGGARAFHWVRRALGVGAAGIAVWLASPAPEETIQWRTYSDSALETAMSERKPVLIDFTADWCAACKELEHKTFSDPNVGRAAQRFIALRADMTNFGGPDAKRWQARFDIKGLPTIVRLEPE